MLQSGDIISGMYQVIREIGTGGMGVIYIGAKEIKKRIWENLNLIASAGVSYNKFLAKIASDYRKPNGLCTIHPSQALDFIARLPIESFWGVGPVTARKMHTLGIHNGLHANKGKTSRE